MSTMTSIDTAGYTTSGILVRTTVQVPALPSFAILGWTIGQTTIVRDIARGRIEGMGASWPGGQILVEVSGHLSHAAIDDMLGAWTDTPIRPVINLIVQQLVGLGNAR